jgi:hypothetical protein
VEGYEYLEGISASLPSALGSIAETHRKTILDAVNVDLNISSNNQEIDRRLHILRAELQSLSHERVVNEVLSRETISSAKRMSTLRPRHTLYSTSSRVEKRLENTSQHVRNGHHNKENQVVTINEKEIIIPAYVPPHEDSRKERGSTSQMTSRFVGSAMMVPSMRQGHLPPEVRKLHTTPQMQPVFLPNNGVRVAT